MILTVVSIIWEYIISLMKHYRGRREVYYKLAGPASSKNEDVLFDYYSLIRDNKHALTLYI